ncbi:MAG: phosphatidylserine decarboxylase family protein [Acidaminococcaceae bacterium]|nr:phosphatidylserine decarboxylase family protein [Acidaminococcaceae bacterium]
MEIVKDGYRIIIGFLILTLAIFYFGGANVAIVPALLTGFFIYFFRNPNRLLPQDDSILYSPADGTVMSIEEFFDDEYLNEEAKKVTIFLSVFNVHVNRAPMSGEIKYQRYTCGGYLPAYKDSASFVNERHAIGLDNGSSRILVIQIAGILARRIVSWVTLGKNVKQGECYGMIKFGSSTELVMPKTVDILVKKGDKVKGGITIIGRQLS